MSAAKEKKKCQNIKRLTHFLILEGQMHLYPSVYFHATDLLKKKHLI